MYTWQFPIKCVYKSEHATWLIFVFYYHKINPPWTLWRDLTLPYTKMLKGRLHCFYDKGAKYTKQWPGQCNYQTVGFEWILLFIYPYLFMAHLMSSSHFLVPWLFFPLSHTHTKNKILKINMFPNPEFIFFTFSIFERTLIFTLQVTG